MYLQKNLVILAITVSLEMNIMCFSITPPSGHMKTWKMKKRPTRFGQGTHQPSFKLIGPATKKRANVNDGRRTDGHG